MMDSGLKAIDWVILVAYAGLTIGLGYYYSRRQRTTQEYFTGGGQMNPILIGVSLFATLLSTISYLSMPGEALGKGPVTLAALLAHPLVFLIVGYGLLPIYMKNRVTSAYELLETKLGLSIRMLGATMFVVLRLAWMSLLVFLTAKAMTIMMGIDEQWIPVIVLATGSVAVIYTSLGGLQAVVITDLVQTILLYGGALLVLAMVSIDLGGFGWFPTQWQDTWDTQPVFSLDPSTRVTVFGSVMTVLVWYVCTAGGDQTSVQRFMATQDLKAARLALATQLCVTIVVAVTLALVGFALLGYFKAHPDRLAEGMLLKQDADHVFPHYIAFHLPPGVSGLVVAAMFAAAMSSIDSGVNSITAVVVTDYLDRFGRTPKTERAHVMMSRLLAFAIGALVVIGSSLMDRVPGNITAVTNKTANLLTTPIFCLFFFALFVPFARPAGVWAGAVCGTLTAAVIAFSGPLAFFLTQHWGFDPAGFGVELSVTVDAETGKMIESMPDPISFQYIGPASMLVNIAVGSLVSALSIGKREHEMGKGAK